jgi:hypothetical protein
LHVAKLLATLRDERSAREFRWGALVRDDNRRRRQQQFRRSQQRPQVSVPVPEVVPLKLRSQVQK